MYYAENNNIDGGYLVLVLHTLGRDYFFNFPPLVMSIFNYIHSYPTHTAYGLILCSTPPLTAASTKIDQP